MSDTRQKTCEERILNHMNSRLADFRALSTLRDLNNAQDLVDACENIDVRDLLDEWLPGMMWEDEIRAALDAIDTHDDDVIAEKWANVPDHAAEEIREAAIERADEYPLGMSRKTVFRIELSTGGPADWLEVIAEKSDRYGYDVERIVYHFADWFDHAERTLSGEEFDTAEAFARSAVYEIENGDTDAL